MVSRRLVPGSHSLDTCSTSEPDRQTNLPSGAKAWAWSCHQTLKAHCERSASDLWLNGADRYTDQRPQRDRSSINITQSSRTLEQVQQLLKRYSKPQTRRHNEVEATMTC